ncbi:MAG: NAD(P)/FAD-dependent oxidoreductase, partial [Planctomycetota bacterium]
MNPAASASDSRPHVVIVGAGFGGLWAARSLAKKPVRVTVIDRNNFHSFFPLLYQVAAAELEPEAIVYPVRGILRRFRNVDFRLGEVRSIEFGSRRVETVEGSIPYDYLVLAVGSTTHYFGVEGAEEHGYSLRTLEEGVSLRNRILRCFERAVYEQDRDLRRELLTFTIVGGGATGVEFVGALAELVFRPLRRDLPEIDFREARILLLEAAPALLQAFPERLRRYAQERLVRMGVEVRTGTQVTRVSPRSVTLADGDEAPTRTVVWTA